MRALGALLVLSCLLLLATVVRPGRGSGVYDCWDKDKLQRMQFKFTKG